MRLTISLLLASAASSSLYLSVACGSTLYGSSGSVGNPPIYTINQSTGTPTTLGASGTSSLSGMASDWRPGSFRIWAVQDATNQLLRINPANGSATVVSAFTAASIRELAFDVNTDTMYATDLINLFRVNPDTAATTLIGNTGQTNLYALAFDLSGTLFGVSSSNNALVKINTSTANATTVGPTGVTAMVDIASRPEDGVMFGVTTGSFSVYRVNTISGAATLVGPYGQSGGINGLAFSPAVPEPASLALLIYAAFALLPTRRRKSVPHNRV